MDLLVDKLHKILENRESQWDVQTSQVTKLVPTHMENTLLLDLHPEVSSRATNQITKLKNLALEKGPLIQGKTRQDKKTEVDQHIFIVPGDILK